MTTENGKTVSLMNTAGPAGFLYLTENNAVINEV